MQTNGKVLSRENLHEILIPRVGVLRTYVARRVPPSLAQSLSVDDVLQEVWTAAYRHAATFCPRGPDAVDRWLMTIVRTKLIDAVRRARRLKRGGSQQYLRAGGPGYSSFSHFFARLQSPGRTPSGEAHLVETAHAMTIAIRCLSDRQRQAVELQYFQGLSRREVAARLDTTEKAVKELVHRGLHLMRDILGPAGKYFSDVRSADASHTADAADAQA